MRHTSTRLLYLTLSVALSLGTPRVSAEVPFDKVYNQLLSEVGLDLVFRRLENVRSPADFERAFVRHLSPRDQSDLLPIVRKLKTIPEFRRLNRGFEYEYEGKRYTFVFKDIQNRRVLVNGTVNWTIDNSSPLLLQFQILSRGLDKTASSWPFSLIDEAHGDPVTLVLVSALIGGLVGISLNGLYQWVDPSLREMYCEGKNPAISYQVADRCKTYFNWKKEKVPEVPEVKPIDATSTSEFEVTPLLVTNWKCPVLPNDPNFSLTVKNGTTGEIKRRTIYYEGKTADKLVPTKLIEQNLPEKKNEPTVFMLKDRKLFQVFRGKTMILSRDPSHANFMVGKKLQDLETYDTVLEATISLLKLCEPEIIKALAFRADQLASVPAGQVKSPPASTSAPAARGKSSVTTY